MSTIRQIEYFPAEIFRDLANSKDLTLSINVPKNPKLIEKLRRSLSLHKTRNQYRYKGKIPENARLAYDLRSDPEDPDQAIMTISIVRTGVISI